MSLIFTDGFDHYTVIAQKWNAVVASVGTSVVAVTTAGLPRTGRGCLNIQNGGNVSTVRKTVAASDEHATFIFGIAVRRPTTTQPLMLALRSDGGATDHVYARCNADGSITVVAAGVAVGTIPVDQALQYADAWYYVELRATLADVGGSVECRVNGVPRVTVSNIDTKFGGTKTVFDSFFITASGTGGAASGIWFLDDLYICNGAGITNNTFLGDVSIRTLLPNAPGTTTQLTPNTAVANWTTVDETAPNTTDFNSSTAAEQFDTYNFEDLPANGNVLGVNVWTYANKNDTGAQGVAPMIRSGGVNYEGASVPLLTTYSYQQHRFETNPAGAAWTPATVNAAEFGAKAKAS